MEEHIVSEMCYWHWASSVRFGNFEFRGGIRIAASNNHDFLWVSFELSCAASAGKVTTQACRANEMLQILVPAVPTMRESLLCAVAHAY